MEQAHSEEVQKLKTAHLAEVSKLHQAAGDSEALLATFKSEASQVASLKSSLLEKQQQSAKLEARVVDLQQDFAQELQAHETAATTGRKSAHLALALQRHLTQLLQAKILALQQESETANVYVQSLEEKLGNNEFRQV